ncbi:MAG: hypothetical protein NZL98_10835 [Anaerolineales bacterium]|nr:hypothetical protein [Anaerolineales bacterium]MDW8227827.1 hypothetical protein [Anaerolineales bacterium]
MQRSALLFSLIVTFGSLVQITPVNVRAWVLDSNVLTPTKLSSSAFPLASPKRADLNGDGQDETVALVNGHLSLFSVEQVVWQSPEEWKVIQAAFTRLNADALPEVSLLVWRPFRPWPVDNFLPYGGRIAGFHDGKGNSCHIILIGWMNGLWTELWAGSALADPMTVFAAVDLNGDGRQELITLEGRYADSGSGPARALKVWEWNGFGFSLLASAKGTFTDLTIVRQEDGRILILTP